MLRNIFAVFTSFISSLIIMGMLSAGEITSYQIVDLGLLGFEQSRVIDINDEGLVFGVMGNSTSCECFLWNPTDGLQVVKLPRDTLIEEVSLNNKGQIAGLRSHALFIWEQGGNVRNIDIFNPAEEDICIQKFTDNGQLLVRSGTDRYFLWDNGIKYDITYTFEAQMPGWTFDDCMIMNSHCDIIINAHKSNGGNSYFSSDDESGSSLYDLPLEFDCQSDTDYKTFIWSKGAFSLLFPEYGENSKTYVHAFDDQKNVIISLDKCENPSITGCYFRDFSTGSLGKLHNNCSFYSESYSSDFYSDDDDDDCNWIISNNAPQIEFCTPSTLRGTIDEERYYTPGADIRKILTSKFPYHLKDGHFQFVKQNALGYVIGNASTVYLKQKHAFLAIPVES